MSFGARHCGAPRCAAVSEALDRCVLFVALATHTYGAAGCTAVDTRKKLTYALEARAGPRFRPGTDPLSADPHSNDNNKTVIHTQLGRALQVAGLHHGLGAQGLPARGRHNGSVGARGAAHFWQQGAADRQHHFRQRHLVGQCVCSSAARSQSRTRGKDGQIFYIY